jgi:hypothetical protein
MIKKIDPSGSRSKLEDRILLPRRLGLPFWKSRVPTGTSGEPVSIRRSHFELRSPPRYGDRDVLEKEGGPTILP